MRRQEEEHKKYQDLSKRMHRYKWKKLRLLKLKDNKNLKQDKEFLNKEKLEMLKNKKFRMLFFYINKKKQNKLNLLGNKIGKEVINNK